MQPSPKGVRLGKKITELKVAEDLPTSTSGWATFATPLLATRVTLPQETCRIFLVTSNIEGTIRSLRLASASQYLLLQNHGKKFLRWIRESTTRRAADRTVTLSKWTRTRRGANGAPARFYNASLSLPLS